MKLIVIELRNGVKKRLREVRRTTRDPGLAMRCQMVLHAAKGRMSPAIAGALGCSRSWVSRVLGRFQAEGEGGLLDRREDNGQQKLDGWWLGQSFMSLWLSVQGYRFTKQAYRLEDRRVGGHVALRNVYALSTRCCTS